MEAEKARKKASAIKIAKAAATGVAIGAAGGILLAPKSGKETRKDIVDGVTGTGEKISNKSKEIADKTGDSIKNTKDKISESKEKIKDYFDKKKNEVEISIEECFDDITQFDPGEISDETCVEECNENEEIENDVEETDDVNDSEETEAK